jgi:hypothetical protein
VRKPEARTLDIMPTLIAVVFCLCAWQSLQAGSVGMAPRVPMSVTNATNGAVEIPFAHLTARTSTPSGAVAGDTWYRSDTDAFYGQGAAALALLMPPLTTVADSTALSNPTAATVFSSSGTIPAGILAAGRIVDVLAFGQYTTGTALTPTLQTGINFDGTDAVTSGLVSTAVSLTSKGWTIQGQFIVRTVGVSGTMYGFARGELGGLLTSALPVSQVARSGSVSIDTTVQHVIKPSAKFGVSDAANSITCEGLIVTVR